MSGFIAMDRTSEFEDVRNTVDHIGVLDLETPRGPVTAIEVQGSMTVRAEVSDRAVAILFFVGVKMCLVHTHLKLDTSVALFVILGLLGAGVVASLLRPLPPNVEAELPSPAGILSTKSPRRADKSKPAPEPEA